MMFLLILILLVLTGLLVAVFTLGFHVAGVNWQRQLLGVRAEAAEASRAMHDLTRRAFIAMAEEADRHRKQ
jgi:hypothetical protein